MNRIARRISSVAAICLALQVVLNLCASFLLSELNIGEKSNVYYVCLCAVSIIINVIPAIIMIRATKKTLPEAEQRQPVRTKKSDNVVVTLGAAALVFAVGLIYERIFPSAAADIPVGTDTSVLRHIILVVSICVVPAICEEFFFREVLARGLSVAGKTAATIVSALAFGVAHLSGVMFPYAFFAGLMFGVLFFRTGKSIYTVAAHFFCNFTSYLFALVKSAMPKDTFSTLEIVTMISFSAAAVLIFCLDSKKAASKKDAATEKAEATSIMTPAMAVYFVASALIILFM